MMPYDLRGRSEVLRRRASAEGDFSRRRLQEDIARLADIAEYQLGFDAMLHSNLAVVRYRAEQQQLLAALDCLDAAIQEFNSHS
ncbi:hypothetical protein AWB74_07609 [Caballeronia arvi]|uniref:Uncharacterized protein n=1 Tax=Caballeronia arvi TaxID=1777135 RepID=A0A158KZ05_9BURK|nr:hypothetical protein [Caballeronia arvi]SAL86215.1 hypothetical protein AWB74_07609 [Caballeronia arvi]